MYPVQLPKSICGEMYGSALFPVIIHIVAHLLYFAGHQMRANGLVLASADLDSRRTPISCVRTDSVENDPVKVQQMGRA